MSSTFDQFGEKGSYEVTSPSIDNEQHRRDFDAECWGYNWISYVEGTFLRLTERNSTDGLSVGYVEFSQPVSIEFVPEDE